MAPKKKLRMSPNHLNNFYALRQIIAYNIIILINYFFGLYFIQRGKTNVECTNFSLYPH